MNEGRFAMFPLLFVADKLAQYKIPLTKSDLSLNGVQK